LTAEPAVVPGTRAAKTMYAALYGELVPHPWPDPPAPGPPAEASQDAYCLFEARSAAMGWLTAAAECPSGGLWGMNDAQAAPGSGQRPAPAAFFQVVLTGQAPVTVLPVQPFLSCAGDVVARLGVLRLAAVQVLLPERDAEAGGRVASPSGMRAAEVLLDAADWFAGGDPRLRAPVRVTLDGGPDAQIRAAAAGVVSWVQDISQDVFTCDSFSLAAEDHLILQPTALHGGPPGTAQHRVTLRGTLAEWSLDALGWLAAFLADASTRHGVSTQLMFTADRSAPAG
jgi:hypothetical protein